MIEEKIETMANSINKGFEDDKNLECVNKAISISPKERLQRSILGLVEDQLTKATSYDIIIQKASKRVEERIDANELSLDSLMQIISTFTSKKLDVIQTVFDPFKSSQKDNLFDARESDSDFEKGLKDMSPEQLKLMDQVNYMIQHANES